MCVCVCGIFDDNWVEPKMIMVASRSLTPDGFQVSIRSNLTQMKHLY